MDYFLCLPTPYYNAHVIKSNLLLCMCVPLLLTTTYLSHWEKKRKILWVFHFLNNLCTLRFLLWITFAYFLASDVSSDLMWVLFFRPFWDMLLHIQFWELWLFFYIWTLYILLWLENFELTISFHFQSYKILHLLHWKMYIALQSGMSASN